MEGELTQISSGGIIDCDVHHVPVDDVALVKRFPPYFRRRGLVLPSGFGIKNPSGVLREDAAGPNGEPPGSLPALMREQLLDAFGIDYAILICAKVLGVGVHPEADFAKVIATAYNDWLIEEWLEPDHDDRFLGSIVVSQTDPEAAAHEIRRVGGHPKVVQVVMTSATRTPLGDKIFWPIYEAASELGLPVAVHPGCECSGIAESFSNGYPSSYLEWHTNLSQNFMAQLTSLVTRGALPKFPDLRFVFIEGGFGWLPHLLWRLDKNWKALRSSAPWVRELPSEYVFRQVRLTTQPIEEPGQRGELEEIMRLAHGESTLMFSSDYPHWDNDSPVFAFKGIDPDLRRRILWENAAGLYGLKSKAGVGAALK